jgi:hypothetical protein
LLGVGREFPPSLWRCAPPDLKIMRKGDFPLDAQHAKSDFPLLALTSNNMRNATFHQFATTCEK